MHKPIDTSAVILAGGLGTRLRSVVQDRPKILAEILGRPYITYLFDQLLNAGIYNVILCTGYMSQLVYDALGVAYKTLKIQYSEEESPLGTGGALRKALPLISSDPVLVMNGDSFIKVDLRQYISWFFYIKRNIAIMLTHVKNAARYGKVLISENGELLSFQEKDIDNTPGWINAGIYLIKKDQILMIPENSNISLEKQIFPALIGKKFYGFLQNSNFIDIGTPESYQQAQLFFKK